MTELLVVEASPRKPASRSSFRRAVTAARRACCSSDPMVAGIVGLKLS
jgi:hypothetical protein